MNSTLVVDLPNPVGWTTNTSFHPRRCTQNALLYTYSHKVVLFIAVLSRIQSSSTYISYSCHNNYNSFAELLLN